VTLEKGSLAETTAAPGPGIVDLEERSWLPRHRRGDSRAFPALMAAYRRPVYAYLVRAGVAGRERDDLFQTVFLKVHAAAGSYDPARPLAPWIFTIVANSVRNHFRDGAAEREAASNEEAPDSPDPAPDPERAAAARETVAWLEGAIRALPMAQREALLLVTVVGLGQQAAAEASGLPLNTLKTNLRRARLALAAGLAAREGSAPDGTVGRMEAAEGPGDCHEPM
jgi:RNA polymerase sigma-70 factor (ECF subfamily)